MGHEKELNLLSDSWLPVRKQDGAIEKISISEIGRPEIEDIVSPRADFRGAIYQLLIGILQTTFTPDDRKTWLKYWEQPPKENELQNAFKPYLSGFDLNAPIGKPAFMQDLELAEGETKPISSLFIEAPGGKTLRDNQDHFVKRGGIEQLSALSAAIAMFTLQINAPSGGVGHRVSIRGGGPLTTLVMPSDKKGYNSLWHKLWLNVFTKEEIQKLPGYSEQTSFHGVLPWISTTRTSENKGTSTFPEHGHPLQVYWSMSRRIRLNWIYEQGTCDLTGEQCSMLVRSYYTKNYGVDYAGHWIHPLTPYVIEAEKEPFTIKAQPGGLGYRHWLGLVIEEKRGKQTRSPAEVVKVYEKRKNWLNDINVDFKPRLWAFGYDMDNMKARCWYEAEMPIFNLKQDQRDDMADHVQVMIHAANDVLKTLKSALKSAWFDRPKDAKGDISFVDANFWSSTEPTFYELLGQLVENLENKDREKEILTKWRTKLIQQAHHLFDQYALSSLNEGGDIKRVIKARAGKGGLEHYLNGSKALKELAA